MQLPKDPIMLLSYTNTKLRDEFSNLDEFCQFYSIEKEELLKKLEDIDYHYNSVQNQFK